MTVRMNFILSRPKVTLAASNVATPEATLATTGNKLVQTCELLRMWHGEDRVLIAVERMRPQSTGHLLQTCI